MKRSKAFTLVELLVVVGIIALLVTMLMPTLGRAMELARRSMCGANLNTIGKGIHIYMTEHEKFPLLHKWGNVTDVLEDEEELWDLSEHCMQNFWLLIKYGTSDKALQCPSDRDYEERQPEEGEELEKYGWVKKENFSFGIHKPYDNDEASEGDNKAPLTSTLQGTFVIMTDKSNGTRVYWDETADKMGNKPQNHTEDGFNCLMYQGSVKFHNCKVGTEDANSQAGIERDDVCVPGDEGGDNEIDDEQTGSEDPTEDTDTFIVPWTAAD